MRVGFCSPLSKLISCCALFDKSCCLQHETNSTAKTGVGTPIYMAPEIIYGGNRYDAKVCGAFAPHLLWPSPVLLPTNLCGMLVRSDA